MCLPTLKGWPGVGVEGTSFNFSSGYLKKEGKNYGGNMKEGFLKLYHETWNEIAHLNLIEKLLYIYLLSKQDRFGGGSFFLCDRVIVADLGISQRTLVRAKRRLISKMPIVYKQGRYRKRVSEWQVLGKERVPNCPREGAKNANNWCQNGTTRDTDRRETDKKKKISQPQIVNNIVVNTTKPQLSDNFLKTMHCDSQRFLK